MSERACGCVRMSFVRTMFGARRGPSPIVFVAQQPAPAALREAPCAISVADTAVRSVDVDLMTAQHNCVCAQDGLAHRRQLLSISALSDTQFAVDAALCGAAVKVRRQGSLPQGCRLAGQHNPPMIACPMPDICSTRCMNMSGGASSLRIVRAFIVQEALPPFASWATHWLRTQLIRAVLRRIRAQSTHARVAPGTAGLSVITSPSAEPASASTCCGATS